MSKYVALLRGINVGGHKKILMADLRELLTNSGFVKVQTYIQSGNVVFESSEKDMLKLELLIHEAIKAQFGFEVPVLVKTTQDLQRIFNACPFSEEKKQASYFTMLHDCPNEDLIKVASEKVYEGEEYEIIDDCIYYYCEKGYGSAKFNMSLFERKLNTTATSRNYKTMVKLIAMSSENE